MRFDHFDLIAGLYNRTAPFALEVPLGGLLSLHKNNLLLDAGGGTGRVAAALRGMVREVVVADLSRRMLHYATAKGLLAVCAPVEHLPFFSGTFDRIIMLDALHHVVNQQLTALELWRVLSPDGRILIVEPDIRKPFVKLLAIGEKILLMRSHFLRGDMIAALFKNAAAQVGVVYHDYSAIVFVQKVR